MKGQQLWEINIAQFSFAKRSSVSCSVMDVYHKKLELWLKIPPIDGIGLRKYAVSLDQCKKANRKSMATTTK